MARPPNLSPLPEHAAIHVPDPPVFRRVQGKKGPVAFVTCPRCTRTRTYRLSVLRAVIKREQRFTGVCRPCFGPTRARELNEKRRKNLRTRVVLKSGYVVLYEAAIPKRDLRLYDAMVTRNGAVFEHRWVMAKLLGRPLRKDECVDHMDGDRANNDPENLRIYRKGLNEPGSCPGAGTFYDEWQRAEAGVRRLRKLLAKQDHGR